MDWGIHQLSCLRDRTTGGMKLDLPSNPNFSSNHNLPSNPDLPCNPNPLSNPNFPSIESEIA